jgi:D-alanine--poly(phosphoribitol) ligase subunit 2
MSDASALRNQISALFSHSLHVDVPSVDVDLFESGILDSLAFVDLLVELERAFGVATSLEDLEADNFRSIARIADYVMARATAAAPVDAQIAAL